ncbi:MAG: hypothetical protein LPJ91_10960 [Pseudazoarcus pumilus]|nr:hypothetical protein [Pseudazoarcus pumilus]
MRLSRIVRPRHPLFWLLVMLQALSTAFLHVLVQRYPVTWLALVLSALVILNSSVSAVLIWRLLRQPD